MKKLLLALMLFVGATAKAQVDNYCLQFDSSGVVNLGTISSLPAT